MKKHTVHILTLFMVIAVLFAIPACGETQYPSPQENVTQEEQPVELVLTDQSTEPVTIEIIEEPATPYPLDETADTNNTYAEFMAADLSDIKIPSYEQINEPFVEINNNQPLFTSINYEEGFEYYSELDDLDRPQTAMALISKTTMPAEGEERGDIGMIKPVGWHTVQYPDVIGGNNEPGYLYNRCHLIGWQLGAENANELNLITGTRYLNVTGMLPFENRIADYVKDNDGHVLYRVTPVYQDNNLLCDGVLLEAQSIENDDCVFCVFCYNVQPDIYIDYLNGDSEQLPLHIEESTETQSLTVNDDPQTTADYVLNTNTLKIHHPDCSSVEDIKPENRQDFNGTAMDLENLIENQNYSYCQRCFN